MVWAARVLQWWRQRVVPCFDKLGNPLKLHRIWDRPLQLWVVNEEFLVRTSHHLVLTTSLPFVHTARRFNRLDGPANYVDFVSGMRRVILTEETSCALSSRG
jgi:hypothetical protein